MADWLPRGAAVLVLGERLFATMQAILESMLPRQAGDRIPKSPAGILCSLADKFDSLVGLFAAGQSPGSTADIYGLRRIAYGVIEVGFHGLESKASLVAFHCKDF